MLFIILGLFTVVFVLVDVLFVTVGNGSGILTKHIASTLWKMIQGMPRRIGFVQPRAFAGPTVVMLNVVAWVVLLWIGWSLVFNGAENAVLHNETRAPAGFWERIYFTGFTIFTLGIGDFVPGGTVFQLFTAMATASGLILVTLSISYIIPVLQAATHKRQLAVQIASLGQTPTDIILNTYDGSTFQALSSHLTALTSDLAKHEQQHLTYPMLHYFHSPHEAEAAALRVAALDEALTILECGFEGASPGIDASQYLPARHTITKFLDTLKEAYIQPKSNAPPAPSLGSLRRQGLSVVDDATFEHRIKELASRRRLLLALVENEGWSWRMLSPGDSA